MGLRADNVLQTPLSRATVTLPADKVANVVKLGPLGPDGGPCKAIRWMGSGAAVLWYIPVTARRGYTVTEAAVHVPNARGAIKEVFFIQGEEHLIQADAIDGDSTAGDWEVTF